VRELPNNHQEKKGFWRKATALVGSLALLNACDQQPPITDGTVYKKQYTEQHNIYIPEKRGFSMVSQPYGIPEEWKIYIAQCLKEELPPQDKIEKECKTNSFAVSQEVFNRLQIRQHANFKQAK
jgi:hypothetical protein